MDRYTNVLKCEDFISTVISLCLSCRLYPEKPSKKKRRKIQRFFYLTQLIPFQLKKHFILQLTKVSVFPLFHLRTNIYIFVFCYPVYYISSILLLYFYYMQYLYSYIHNIKNIYIKRGGWVNSTPYNSKKKKNCHPKNRILYFIILKYILCESIKLMLK